LRPFQPGFFRPAGGGFEEMDADAFMTAVFVNFRLYRKLRFFSFYFLSLVFKFQSFSYITI